MKKNYVWHKHDCRVWACEKGWWRFYLKIVTLGEGPSAVGGLLPSIQSIQKVPSNAETPGYNFWVGRHSSGMLAHYKQCSQAQATLLSSPHILSSRATPGWVLIKIVPLAFDPAIGLLESSPDLLAHLKINMCTRLLLATLFITTKTWKQPKCSPEGDWLNLTWCTQTVE